ncbi:hypothetical protein CALVIDRAFT_524671 [Calocera viscosa TUFC12733]|uniref:Uncharacterized protein n=1 Tax=Calocera viscosa (strain TUFC12733) TaxID=1330018 RepID=A0A167RJT0_CALVF|nr:hypothetical protein CALVIDRAFT_524671 [Calocera viscosa TUFC12733]
MPFSTQSEGIDCSWALESSWKLGGDDDNAAELKPGKTDNASASDASALKRAGKKTRKRRARMDLTVEEWMKLIQELPVDLDIIARLRKGRTLRGGHKKSHAHQKRLDYTADQWMKRFFPTEKDSPENAENIKPITKMDDIGQRLSRREEETLSTGAGNTATRF